MSREIIPGVIELTEAEGRDFFDRACREHLSISGREFLDRYLAGAFRDYDGPEGHLLMLLPFAGRGRDDSGTG